jgi:hypothetical protein
MRTFPRRLARVWPLAVAAFLLIAARGVSGQLQYSTGQEVAPDYSGWEANPDGSFNLVFGYMNRNYEEHLHIPIGPNNKFEPGDIDRGQPTYFYPRRGRYVFRIKVPADFGKKELVWTLTSNGKTRQAFATLKPDYALDNPAIYLNNSGYSMVGKAVKNEAPAVTIEGAAQRTAKVGEALTLTALVTDDGIPQRRAVPTGGGVGFKSAMGLRVAWMVYRGPGEKVTFMPEQFKVYADFLTEGGNSPYSPGWAPPPLPPDGKHTVRATFSEPGTYVLRASAHDGGFETARDVTVKVQ